MNITFIDHLKEYNNSPQPQWLDAAIDEGKLAVSNDFSEIKSFLEKNGSNHLLADKKVGFKWKRPFEILINSKALEVMELSENKTGLNTKKASSPVAWRRLDDVKFFFGLVRV